MKFLLFCTLLTTHILSCMENSNTSLEEKAEWIISHPKLSSDLKDLIYGETLLNLKNAAEVKSLNSDLPLIFYKTNFSNLQSKQIDPFLALGFIIQKEKAITYYQPKNSADLVKHETGIYHVQAIETELDWTKIDDQNFKINNKRNSDEVKIQFSQTLSRYIFINDLISLENIDLSRGYSFRIMIEAYCPFSPKNSFSSKGSICTDKVYSDQPFIFFKVASKNNKVYDKLIFYNAINKSLGFFGNVETGELPTQTNYFFTSLNEYKKYLEEKNWVLNEQQATLTNNAYVHLDALKKEKPDAQTLQKAQEFLTAFKSRNDKIKILWLTQDELTKQNPFKKLHELLKNLTNNNNS
ncbi:MAG: hypothetical protein BWY54_00032 [Candidatus Dependentiae bacterium ADurb.Bin331]|nr:MAG: hypothetical protein BWY54_00032 [Candidatus Dependentiae bacterium ADurb.Bin331]